MTTPVCLIIAGVNGAGKTTFALEYLSNASSYHQFINADLIAAGLSPLSPELKQTAASKIFLQQIKQLVHQRKSFALETTLSGRGYLKLIKQLKNDGWLVELIYLYLPSVKLSMERVAERVMHGGHNIPIDAIKRRYPRSLNNLMNEYMPLCDKVICLDNSGSESKVIFISTHSGLLIKNQRLYENIMAGVRCD